VGAEIRAVPVSPLKSKWNAVSEWAGEFGSAFNMGVWWLIGSPSLGMGDGGWEFGPGDKETEYIRNTAAYQEAVEIYKEWRNNGRPSGKFEIKGTPCEFVPAKGYFYVKGRTGAGRGPRGHWTEPLQHPLWGFTGDFAIRFTEWGYPTENYVAVEIENYTSLPSYMHGLGFDFSESWYTKRSGIPILSRSRQLYRFVAYIPPNSPAIQEKADVSDLATHNVVAGDSLSGLARAYYGDMDLWPIIFDRNRNIIGPNPDRIKVGQSLVIPAKRKLTPEQTRHAKATARLWRHGMGSRAIEIEPLR
jgi:LysM repeat protein